MTTPKLCAYRGTFTVTVRIPEIAAIGENGANDITESIKQMLESHLQDMNLNGIFIEISTGKQSLREIPV